MKQKLNFFLTITLLSILIISSFSLLNQFNSDRSNKVNDDYQGLSLIPPVSAATETPPLDTDSIGLIAYYNRGGPFTLSNTVPAFVSYDDGGNYHDGLVRVWDSGTIGSESTTNHDTYVDVHVRVRADGWILAWFDRLYDDPASIVWWGRTSAGSNYPAAYSTTLSRAIQIVFSVAGISFPGYDAVSIYDYSQPTATRLIIFGKYCNSGTENYYYTIPDSSNVVPIKYLIRAGGSVWYNYHGYLWLKVDGNLVYSIIADTQEFYWSWHTYELDAAQYMTKGVQHSITQSACSSGSHSVAFIMWTG